MEIYLYRSAVPWFLIIPLLGPFSGSFAFALGFPSSFWFCKDIYTSFSSFDQQILSFLPETLRALVSNGSVTPPPINRPLISVVGRKRHEYPASPTPPKPRYKNPLPILLNMDILLLLIFNGMFVAVYFGITASISTLFQEIYPFLNQTQVGLCYLTVGVGSILGSVLSGKLLDWDFQQVKRKELAKRGVDRKTSAAAEEDLRDFPIEKVQIHCFVRR
jgi:hypothetical protein